MPIKIIYNIGASALCSSSLTNFSDEGNHVEYSYILYLMQFCADQLKNLLCGTGMVQHYSDAFCENLKWHETRIELYINL